jgi:hypothetical protein
VTAVTCDQLHDLADELALDMLTGTERAAALLHLEHCESCRSLIASLTISADVVLLATPVVPPPAGFESKVLTRVEQIAHPSPMPRPARRGHRWRRRLTLAAAALAVVLAVVVLTPDAGTQSTAAAAEMRAADGTRVGAAYVNDADRTGLVVKVTDWETASAGQPTLPYQLAVDRDDGTRELVPLEVAYDYSWHVSLDTDAGDVAAVSLVDGAGRVLCSGSFEAAG